MTDSNAAFNDFELKTPCRPFIKWVGGKSQIIKHLVHRLPKNFNRYFEPFIGGGALFFHLQPRNAVLSDINSELIDTYLAIRDDVEGVIEELQMHRYEKDYFYQVRAWDRSESFSKMSRNKRAARLIYLNKCCFNGLHRVNSEGHFNVPFGKYTNPTIVDAHNLRNCCSALKNVELKSSNYQSISETIGKEDFVYFDPPYMPISATSSFTSYSKDGFNQDSQVKLMETCTMLDQKGAFFMLSNSSAQCILDLYKNFEIELVPAKRAINSVGSSRGCINEILVRNF